MSRETSRGPLARERVRERHPLAPVVYESYAWHYISSMISFGNFSG